MENQESQYSRNQVVQSFLWLFESSVEWNYFVFTYWMKCSLDLVHFALVLKPMFEKWCCTLRYFYRDLKVKKTIWSECVFKTGWENIKPEDAIDKSIEFASINGYFMKINVFFWHTHKHNEVFEIWPVPYV